jgi:hypothetical protein
VLQTVPVLKHDDIGTPGRGDFLKSLPWLILPMEEFEHLLLATDGLVEDPALSYMPEQLHHHVAAQVLFTNPPPEGIER